MAEVGAIFRLAALLVFNNPLAAEVKTDRNTQWSTELIIITLRKI
jgi:hypothetical protein